MSNKMFNSVRIIILFTLIAPLTIIAGVFIISIFYYFFRSEVLLFLFATIFSIWIFSLIIDEFYNIMKDKKIEGKSYGLSIAPKFSNDIIK